MKNQSWCYDNQPAVGLLILNVDYSASFTDTHKVFESATINDKSFRKGKSDTELKLLGLFSEVCWSGWIALMWDSLYLHNPTSCSRDHFCVWITIPLTHQEPTWLLFQTIVTHANIWSLLLDFLRFVRRAGKSACLLPSNCSSGRGHTCLIGNKRFPPAFSELLNKNYKLTLKHFSNKVLNILNSKLDYKWKWKWTIDALLGGGIVCQ